MVDENKDGWDATQWHEVKKGETLWKIAQQYYGDGSLYPKIFGRVDIHSKAKKLPANLDKAAADSAKTGLESMNKAWAEAQASYSLGNLADALAKANAVKSQAAEIMTKLGMTVPAALKS